ncbi:unnamed protein product, partial [Allacma fusca]
VALFQYLVKQGDHLHWKTFLKPDRNQSKTNTGFIAPICDRLHQRKTKLIPGGQTMSNKIKLRFANIHVVVKVNNIPAGGGLKNLVQTNDHNIPNRSAAAYYIFFKWKDQFLLSQRLALVYASVRCSHLISIFVDWVPGIT